MGRQSRWKSRIIIIGIFASIMTPVAIYSYGELTPYLNIATFFQEYQSDDSLGVLQDMVFVDSNADAQGNWDWIITRLDILFTNPLIDKIRLPATDVTVNYLHSQLAYGYIAEEIEINPGESKIVSAYVKGYNNALYSAYLRKLFIGGEFNLQAEMSAYILVDGVLGEPLFGLKFPVSVGLPFPIDISSFPPLIYSIERGQIQPDNDVTITVNASDFGAGIYAGYDGDNFTGKSFVSYSVDGGSWQTIELEGDPWDTSFRGLQTGSEYPIFSSYAKDPVLFTAEIPGQKIGASVFYYVQLEDYVGSWEHDKPGNIATSDIYSYIVKSGIQDANKTVIDVDFEIPFIFEFLSSIEERGISILHLAYEFNITVLELTPLLGTISYQCYQFGLDADYFLALLLSDFIKGLELLFDCGVSPGILLETLGNQFGFDFDDILAYILPRICLPSDDSVKTYATNALEALGDINHPDHMLHKDLENYFEQTIFDGKTALGITATEFQEYIFPDPFLEPGDQFRSIYTMALGPIGVGGRLILDWSYNTSESPYWNWLYLISTSTSKNNHLAGANLLIRSTYSNKPQEGRNLFEEVMYLLNGDISAIPSTFPANDLYPHIHSFLALIMLLTLGVVSYFVLKREILVFRKVKSGLIKKKVMK